jgi:hypothetical protein
MAGNAGAEIANVLPAETKYLPLVGIESQSLVESHIIHCKYPQAALYWRFSFKDKESDVALNYRLRRHSIGAAPKPRLWSVSLRAVFLLHSPCVLLSVKSSLRPPSRNTSVTTSTSVLLYCAAL